MENTYRYKITLEYLGSGYCGWQRQKDGLSLQQIVEDAIYAFSKERVSVSVAGRTDAGVNAYGQVAHFDLSKDWAPGRVRFACGCSPNDPKAVSSSSAMSA